MDKNAVPASVVASTVDGLTESRLGLLCLRCLLMSQNSLVTAMSSLRPGPSASQLVRSDENLVAGLLLQIKQLEMKLKESENAKAAAPTLQTATLATPPVSPPAAPPHEAAPAAPSPATAAPSQPTPVVQSAAPANAADPNQTNVQAAAPSQRTNVTDASGPPAVPEASQPSANGAEAPAPSQPTDPDQQVPNTGLNPTLELANNTLAVVNSSTHRKEWMTLGRRMSTAAAATEFPTMHSLWQKNPTDSWFLLWLHFAPAVCTNAEERTKLLKTWTQNNMDLGLTEAKVKLTKSNSREFEGGLELMTVKDMVEAKFSK